MVKKISLYFFFLLLPVLVFAQRIQTVRGSIVDKESKSPLIGVAVVLKDVQPFSGTTTDSLGRFKLNDVPVGKHELEVKYMGYGTYAVSDLVVTSAKEVVLTIEMEETSVKMKEVEVHQRREHINDMALVSTKTFDVAETERYAGSRSDPARMASNFAGVQGGDDSRNDIIIRGNSPQGVLWRLEGIDIPNPNHFAVPGTTGGPVSMLNSKTLGNSDFFTGAFPAEYGDAVAGVFDLKLRNGNNDKYEFTGQFGFLGTELSAEGPISRKDGSSFLVAYRYSTLKIFEGLNIKIGTTSVPNYQDLTFKLNYPMGKKGNLSFFGIGGLSNIDLIVSTLTKPEPQLYGESDRDQYFTSNTGIAGAEYSYTIDANTYTKLTVGISGNNIFANHNYVFRDSATFHTDSLKPILGYDFKTTTGMLHWLLNKKLSSRQTLKFGIVDNYYHLNLLDSSRQYPVTRQDWQRRENFIGSTDLAEAYVQYKYRPSDKLAFTGGVHAQYLSHNGSSSVEPRIGMRWAIDRNNVFTAGYGLHSQMQQLYQYFAHNLSDSPSVMQNYNVGFTRSHHMVAAYEHILSNVMRLRLESYYQYLFQVPIETVTGSSYSALDQGSSYSRDFPSTLVNKGVGYNYGAELTLEKRMNQGYYFLITGSLFDSKARGNDGVFRSTDFNSKYAVNLLFGYEHKISKYGTFIAGGKVTYAGGKLYSPVDTAATRAYGDIVVVDSKRNTLKFPDYFRADLKLGAKFNSKKVTHEVGLDLVNIFGTKNVLSITYSDNTYYKQYQLGFLPIFYYRIDFGIASPKGH